MTTFDLPEADYTNARASFVEMKDEAWKKVDQIQKDLGHKWDEARKLRKLGEPTFRAVLAYL